ncbi:MAG TPA: hypothetical protein DCG57_01930 [Candidatus Riflebacteria bacterium]|jgi:hypothetical protein|nr:hypothetical protein [Candidatus Riflebacteria bacterium]
MKTKHSTGELLERRYDDEALAELTQNKSDAAKLAAGRLRRLKPGFSIDAAWLCRVLGSVSADPLGALLSVLPVADFPKHRIFAIAAQCWAQPKDAARILKALKKLVPAAFTSSGKCELPEALNQHCGMTGVSILLESLARLEPASILAPARRLFAAALDRLPKSSKSRSYEAQNRAVDFLPLLAASAAALLAAADVEGATTDRDRETWESACIRAALDPAMYSATCICGAPLPFLFVGSAGIAGRLIAKLMQEAEDPAAILAQTEATLKESRRMGFTIAITMPALTGDEAMEIHRSQKPEAVVMDVLSHFRDAMIETSLIVDAMDQLGDGVPAATFPAIAVETMFANHTCNKYSASVRENAEQRLNAQLKRAGMRQFKELSWKAPPGKRHGIDELTSLEALEETLRAIHDAIHEAAQTPDITASRHDTAAFVRNLFPHTLCRHAIYRNLVCELCKLPEERYPDLISLLPESELERDAGMIKMIGQWSDKVAPEPFNALLAKFLDHQLMKSDMDLLERVVERLARAPKPAFHKPLKELKKHLAKAQSKDIPNRSSAAQAVDELLLALGSVDSIADFSEKIANNMPVSTDEKMTMLRLAAADRIVLDQGLFEKLFSEAIESEHLTWTGSTAAITGRQVREYIMKILRDKDSSDAKVISVARYCFWARKDGVPALALAAILERLCPAVELAKSNSGETWEDRNWGGYTPSGSEELAEALSLAVKGFAGSDCNAIGWSDFVSELMRLSTKNLSKIKLGESTTCGFSFPTINLLARLESKFKRLNDPGLTKAIMALRKKPSQK